jgi:membrane protein implicated in regulation of membrane protease activity
MFIVIELVTPQLVTIWFAIGSLLAFIVSFFTDSLAIQLVVFASSSILLLVFTKPLVKKVFRYKPIRVNADSNIGATGLVVEDIENVKNTGQVKINGTLWSACSENDDIIIKKDTLVIVKEIKGVKLIVNPKI